VPGLTNRDRWKKSSAAIGGRACAVAVTTTASSLFRWHAVTGPGHQTDRHGASVGAIEIVANCGEFFSRKAMMRIDVIAMRLLRAV
jgi:hypothetical protein